MALQAVDTSPGMHYLFAPSSTSDNTVRRGEKRNVEGQLLYHTILLKSPWKLSANYRDDILDLMSEKDPYLFTRSQPDPNYPYIPNPGNDWGEDYVSTDRQKALQTIQTTKASIVVLLKRIHRFTSHTFHVLIRELIPGAKADKSNLFTMIKEHRNQYMIRARSTGNTEPYTAKDTLDFIEGKFVKTNANTAHIAWSNILLHTRIIGQAIYQWQASFDPLIRKFEQARSKKMRKSQTKDVKQLIAKQITDSEKIILSGISAKYSIDNVDKGTFVLKEFQDDLALNTARFKGYTPDARIVAHLRTRAKEFNAEVPSFLSKRPQDTDQPGKRKCKRFQHYLTNDEAEDADSPDEEQLQLFMGKGRPKGLGKGKGKGKKGGKGKGENRNHQPRPTLSFDGSKGKGKGKPSFQNHYKGKGKFFSKGNRVKGKPIAIAEANTSPAISSHTSIVCGFCHIIGHTTENCRKRLALHNNTLYQQTRSKFSGRQQLLFAGLENSVFSADTCSWCLQMKCNGTDCTPPEEPLFFTQTNNAFCEEILPLVKNAKLELPVGSSDPLSPQHFHFQESYWGDDYSYPYAHQYADSEHDSYIYDVNNDYEYNQYHYPPQNYDDGWDSYNYEEEAHPAAYVPADRNQSNEPDEDYSTSEGLLCEEDTEAPFFSDDLNQ
jgi:hypothetical protein